MISKAVMEALMDIVPKKNIHIEEPMAAHTTFRVGGPADCLVEIESTEQLKKVQKYLRLIEEPYTILGNGSNLLVSDKGYRGIVLQIANKMSDIRVEGNTITAQAGALLSKVAKAALDHGLTGLEFASGIPGSIGGAVVMNAGAYDGEMKQVITSVTVLDQEGEELILDNPTMEFGYRTSVIKYRPFLVTEVTMTLTPADPTIIKSTMDDLATRRREKQPLEYPSAGSTFKRPQGHYAGQLIMEAGLKGFQIGGARVSDKHCGFVINTGSATAADVAHVIHHVQQTVKEKFDITLEPEVIMLGDF
ncbi:MAG: UDP-N-acetylmuramate dehydrogenase [Lachnospiraceae bacterium]|nr:UDP-N-acetylmuramate dehydrogenase [Lachnospiraceae bacterium]